MLIFFILDVKNWKIKTDFNVKKASDEFKKSIKCPDPQSCDIELGGKEFYLKFPKNNNNIFQNTNLSNKHFHTNLIKNEISKSMINSSFL